MSWWEDGFPPPSRPIRVEGGIRVRSKRGAIGESWWSQRFIGVLESLGMGGRLTRGKSYARAGQVIDLEVAAGSIAATVQGSRSEPYRTWVETRLVWPQQWERIEHALAARAVFSAKLLAGEMPRDIDEVFGQQGLALFPAGMDELELDCSCPDAAVPCKHLAATLYVFAEALDDDPFLLLAWRGREREQLLADLRELRGSSDRDDAATEHDVTDLSVVLDGDHAALSDSIAEFWTTPEPPDGGDRDGGDTPVPAPEAGLGDGVLPHLGRPDIELRGHNLADLLRPVYRTLTERRPGDPPPGASQRDGKP